MRHTRKGEIAFGFWLTVLVICLITALLAYQAGKNWVGRQLESTILGRSISIKAQQDTQNPGPGLTPEGKQLPPGEIKVEIEPRPPNEAEKLELTSEEMPRTDEVPGAAADIEAPPDAGAPEGTGYIVTAGSFTSPQAAETARSDLAARGYSPYVTESEQRGVTYHRVVVGVYGSKQRAEAVRAELQKAGFAAGVTRR